MRSVLICQERGWQRESKFTSISSCKVPPPIAGTHPYDLTTSQEPHLPTAIIGIKALIHEWRCPQWQDPRVTGLNEAWAKSKETESASTAGDT